MTEQEQKEYFRLKIERDELLRQARRRPGGRDYGDCCRRMDKIDIRLKQLEANRGTT